MRSGLMEWHWELKFKFVQILSFQILYIFLLLSICDLESIHKIIFFRFKKAKGELKRAIEA